VRNYRWADSRIAAIAKGAKIGLLSSAKTAATVGIPTAALVCLVGFQRFVSAEPPELLTVFASEPESPKAAPSERVAVVLKTAAQTESTEVRRTKLRVQNLIRANPRGFESARWGSAVAWSSPGAIGMEPQVTLGAGLYLLQMEDVPSTTDPHYRLAMAVSTKVRRVLADRQVPSQQGLALVTKSDVRALVLAILSTAETHGYTQGQAHRFLTEGLAFQYGWERRETLSLAELLSF